MSEKPTATPEQRAAWDQFWTARAMLLAAALICAGDDIQDQTDPTDEETRAQISNDNDEALWDAAMAFVSCDLRVTVANSNARRARRDSGDGG